MVEIANEYEVILKRRNENCTESMLRTAYIRDRLEARYGSMLHFEKMNNYEVRTDTLLSPSIVFCISGYCGRIGKRLKLRSPGAVDIRCLDSADKGRYPVPTGDQRIHDVHDQ